MLKYIVFQIYIYIYIILNCLDYGGEPSVILYLCRTLGCVRCESYYSFVNDRIHIIFMAHSIRTNLFTENLLNYDPRRFPVNTDLRLLYVLLLYFWASTQTASLVKRSQFDQMTFVQFRFAEIFFTLYSTLNRRYF